MMMMIVMFFNLFFYFLILPILNYEAASRLDRFIRVDSMVIKGWDVG